MREILQRWLTRRPPCPGVAAWGLCFPDQAVLTRSFAGEEAPAVLETVWFELAEALRQAPQHDLETAGMRWVFSQHVLYAAARPDGTCLGVLADAKLDEAGRSCIERTLSDFKALRGPATAK
jgi:hypothetical protein